MPETIARPGAAPDTRPACPPRPSSSSPSELGFVRRPMVRWLDPHQLFDTAARVLLSGVFSAYADNRELQALVPGEVFDRSDAPGLWVDYVADLGDGWNSTYTIARLLAVQELDLEWDGEVHHTERGSVLVMGGDQVYPVPKRVEYENRLLGPYRSALPCAPPDPPDLFAIPGSHDWYDGLVNFMSIFCRRRWIGGWRTRQRRSYFAAQLPGRWWLWGIDIQFGSFIDEAQVAYFSEVAATGLAPGDRIVLCSAKEVRSGRNKEEIHSDRDVAYLEREVVNPTGARIELHVKSGRHHYCRYEEEGGTRQQITSGGGGAFLHPTHTLHERVEREHAEGRESYRRAAVYPSPSVSKKLRKRVWLLAPYNLPLAALFGAVHVLVAFMMGLHLRRRHVGLAVEDLWRAVWESPTAFLLILLMGVLLVAMVRLAHDARGPTRLLLGVAHSALQLASVGGVLVVASHLTATVDPGSARSLAAFLAVVAVLGGLAGVVGISGYLWVANGLGLHGNEAFAPLHHMDLKHFLRLHVDADGTLTVYPVAVDRVGRQWRLAPEDPPEAPWFAPAGPEPAARLIEAPVRLAPG